MAKQTVIVSLLADTKKFQKGFDSLGSKVGRFAKGAIATVGAIGAAVVGLSIAGGIDRALKIDDAQAKLRGLGYTSQQIEGVMTDALGAVTGTAFGLEDAVTQAANAMAAGVPAGQELERYLTDLADAATIAGVDMSEMGSIWNKVFSSGRFQTQEMNQLLDRGIPILQWLADEYGVTADAMRQMVTSGEISAEDFQRVMNDNIAGAALESGNTVRGSFANMRAAMSRWGLALVGDALPMAQEFFNTAGAGFDALTKLTAPVSEAFWSWVNDNLGPALEQAREYFTGLTDSFDGWNLSDLLGKLQDFAGAFSPLYAIFQELAPHAQELWDSLKNVGTALRESFGDILPQLQTLMQQFGSSVADLAMGLLPILTDILTLVADAAGQLLPVLLNLAGTVLEALSPVIESLLPVIEELAGVFGDALAAALPVVVDLVTMLAETAADLLPALMPLITAALDIVAAFLPLLPVLLELTTAILPPLISLLSFILEPIIALVGVIVEQFTPGLEWLSEALGVLIGWIADGIAWFADFDARTSEAAAHIQSQWAPVIEFFTGLWENLSSIFSTAWTIISDILGTAWEVITTIFSTAGETIKTLVAGAILFITRLFKGDFAGAQEVVRKVWDRISSLFSGAGEKIRGLVSTLVARVKAFFGNMADGMRDKVRGGLDKVGQFFRELPGKVLGWLASLPGKLADVGRNMIQGLINGIGGAAQWLKNAISNAVGGMLDWAKSLLGIASPSKVFRQLGRWTIQGLENGLSAPNALNSIMTGLTSDIEHAFDPTLQMNTASGGRFAASGSGDIHIHVTAGVGDPVEIGREIVRALEAQGRAGGRKVMFA